MDVGAQRNHEIADLFGHAVIFGAFQVDGNRSRRGLGAQCGCIPGNLISYKGNGILLTDAPGNDKLNGDTNEMHKNHHQEHFP